MAEEEKRRRRREEGRRKNEEVRRKKKELHLCKSSRDPDLAGGEIHTHIHRCVYIYIYVV